MLQIVLFSLHVYTRHSLEILITVIPESSYKLRTDWKGHVVMP